jgi:hypothetical protein
VAVGCRVRRLRISKIGYKTSRIAAGGAGYYAKRAEYVGYRRSKIGFTIRRVFFYKIQ